MVASLSEAAQLPHALGCSWNTTDATCPLQFSPPKQQRINSLEHSYLKFSSYCGFLLIKYQEQVIFLPACTSRAIPTETLSSVIYQCTLCNQPAWSQPPCGAFLVTPYLAHLGEVPASLTMYGLIIGSGCLDCSGAGQARKSLATLSPIRRDMPVVSSLHRQAAL